MSSNEINLNPAETLYYPCGGFDGFILRVVNTSNFDGESFDLEIANYLYVDSEYKQRFGLNMNGLVNFYFDFSAAVGRIGGYDFEIEDCELFENELISITKIPHVIHLAEQKNLPAAAQETQCIEDEDNEWSVVPPKGWNEPSYDLEDAEVTKFLQQSLNDRRIFKSMLGTKKSDSPVEGKEIIRIICVIADIFDFHESVLLRHGFVPKVLVMKSMEGNQREYENKIDEKFAPEYIITENLHKADFSYSKCFGPFHNWQVPLFLYKKDKKT
jgi:hypothetical protein